MESDRPHPFGLGVSPGSIFQARVKKASTIRTRVSQRSVIPDGDRPHPFGLVLLSPFSRLESNRLHSFRLESDRQQSAHLTRHNVLLCLPREMFKSSSMVINRHHHHHNSCPQGAADATIHGSRLVTWTRTRDRIYVQPAGICVRTPCPALEPLGR